MVSEATVAKAMGSGTGVVDGWLVALVTAMVEEVTAPLVELGFTTIEVAALLVELGFTPTVAEVMGFTTIEVAALLVELDFTLAEVTPTSDVTAAVMALHSLSPQFAAPLKHCPVGGVGHSSHLPREEEATHCGMSTS
jgi:hypothetical protein